MKRPFFWYMIILLLLLAALPYLLAWNATPEGYRYMWNSYNPPDTDTYLAKMRLGWQGEWRFRLMFTPETEQKGAYLNLFYIALGHLARWLRLPLPAVYHGARLAMGGLLLTALWWLSDLAASGSSARRWGFWFALVGGGVGWAAALLHLQSVDLRVPEAYGFLGMLVNPHFPLAQALLAVIFGLTMIWLQDRRCLNGYIPVLLGFLLVALGLVQAFAVATVGLAWGICWIIESLEQRHVAWRTLLVMGGVGAAGALYPLYGVWAIRQDSALAAWNAQNITLSPPWWSWGLGYALVLPLAVVGAFRSWQDQRWYGRVLLAWAAATVVGIAAPLAIQRRFSLGLSLPLGLLAGLGWEFVLSRVSTRSILTRGVLIVLTCATPLTMLLAGVNQPQLLDSLYISEGEMAAVEVVAHEGPGHVILASPMRGTALPWLTGQQVVVGHLMETVNFSQRSKEAEAFFRETWNVAERRAYLCREGVDYVWVGPLERSLLGNESFTLSGTRLLVQNDDVQVWAVEDSCGSGK